MIPHMMMMIDLLPLKHLIVFSFVSCMFAVKRQDRCKRATLLFVEFCAPYVNAKIF